MWQERSNPDSQPVRIKQLAAQRLDADLVRLKDGKATWMLGKKSSQSKSERNIPTFPRFDELLLVDGRINVHDAANELEAQINIRLSESATQKISNQSDNSVTGLKASAKGSYKNQALSVELATIGILPWVDNFQGKEGGQDGIPLNIDGSIGNSSLVFDGRVGSAIRLEPLQGRFSVSGPSLATVGKIFGVVLPSTNRFKLKGELKREGEKWDAEVSDARVGRSILQGTFLFDKSGKVPSLRGEVKSQELVLADLLPAIGGKTGNQESEKKAKQAGRILPDREFDLPSLNRMNADVQMSVAIFHLGQYFSQPLRPLNVHIKLTNGVLSLSDINAKTPQGRLQGFMSLDGNGKQAQWKADLALEETRLEHWLNLDKNEKSEPLISGAASAFAKFEGQGRSTADILATLDGSLKLIIAGGKISRLTVAKAGLNIAKIVAIYFGQGDAPIEVGCAASDWRAHEGIFDLTPTVIDTPDAAVVGTGIINFAQEQMDVGISVAPRKVSLVSLRTPVQFQGSFADPALSIDLGPIAGRVAVAGGLAALNPFAALLAFIDPGSKDTAEQLGQVCRDLSSRKELKRRAMENPQPAKKSTTRKNQKN